MLNIISCADIGESPRSVYFPTVTTRRVAALVPMGDKCRCVDMDVPG
jgi:hypothetical protein